MEYLLNNPSLIWFAIAILTFILEFSAAPGLGFLFAGLGALITGALLEYGVINSLLAQLVCFTATTAFWALLLWKPMKNAILNKGVGKNTSHIIGTEAIVAVGGVDKKHGSAKWSGTEMKARLAADSEQDKLEEGALTEVVGLDGSVLILKAK